LGERGFVDETVDDAADRTLFRGVNGAASADIPHDFLPIPKTRTQYQWLLSERNLQTFYRFHYSLSSALGI